MSEEKIITSNGQDGGCADKTTQETKSIMKESDLRLLFITISCCGDGWFTPESVYNELNLNITISEYLSFLKRASSQCFFEISMRDSGKCWNFKKYVTIMKK